MAEGFNPAGVWGPKNRGFNIGVVQHAGRVIHLTGQVAWDEHEGLVGLGDVRAQAHQCFRNIIAVLAAVGGTLDDIVAMATYFTDRSQLPIIQQVRCEYLRAIAAPASTSVMVAGLGHKDFLLELTPVAVIPDDRFKNPASDSSAPTRALSPAACRAGRRDPG